MSTTTETRKLTVPECHKLICQPGTPWEIEEIMINGLKQRSWKHQPLHYRALFLDMFAKHANNVLIDSPTQYGAHDDRESLTYAEALDEAFQLAGWMRMRGIGVEDRVGFISFNNLQWPVVFVAIHLLGAVPVLINTSLQVDNLAHCIKISEPKIILADAALTSVLYENRDRLATELRDNVFSIQDVSRLPMSHQMQSINLHTLRPPQDVVQSVRDGKGLEGLCPDSDASIFFTSGTTGYPKAVLATQRANMHNLVSATVAPIRSALRQGMALPDILAAAAVAAAGPPNVSLLAIPFFHGTGCLSWLVKCIKDGAKLVLMRRWSVKDAVKLMVEHNVNAIGGVPSITSAIIKSGLLPKDHKIRVAAYGGALPAENLAQDVVDTWPEAIPSQGWGMTETTVMHCSHVGKDYLDKPKSTGPAVPICDVKIVDPETKKEVPTGVVGSILARGPNIMKCYVGNEKATNEVIDKDGWLDSGDAGYVDDEGCLYIADRIKDIIIRGGENIASAEVENAAYQDKRIAEAASVPVPHDVLGELVALGVTLTPGAKVTPDEIIQLMSARLRKDARPVFVHIFDELLPRNINGKLVKADIKKVVQEKYKQSLARQSKL